MTRAIRIVCENCKRSMNYARSIDPTIPEVVTKITQPHCDVCWNGDREDETWYDAAGKEVPQSADAVRAPNEFCAACGRHRSVHPYDLCGIFIPHETDADDAVGEAK